MCHRRPLDLNAKAAAGRIAARSASWPNRATFIGPGATSQGVYKDPALSQASFKDPRALGSTRGLATAPALASRLQGLSPLLIAALCSSRGLESLGIGWLACDNNLLRASRGDGQLPLDCKNHLKRHVYPCLGRNLVTSAPTLSAQNAFPRSAWVVRFRTGCLRCPPLAGGRYPPPQLRSASDVLRPRALR